MNKLIKLGLVASLGLSVANLMAQETDRDRIKSVKGAVGNFAHIDAKDISIVDKFKLMFSDGKVTGQVKSVYAGYNQKEIDAVDTYSTAIGGLLKYELAKYNGFNAGVAFNTSNDMAIVSGDRDAGKNNDELSSSNGKYTQLTEVYINYAYQDLNLRIGRQVLDTPLADSDDIRMIANTFEAYVATYSISDFELMAGNIQRWQGVDAGLDDGWSKTGEDGTWFGGVSYDNGIAFNAWFYNITKLTNASYIDLGYGYDIDKEIALYGSIQYLNEQEIDNSGVKASIYGVSAELVIYGLGFNIAYNKSDKQQGKGNFSGAGGGSLFTNMDTMIIDEITQDRDASAIVAGLAYDIGNWKFLYAYGDFKGEANSAGEKQRIVEQDIGFEYTVNEEFSFAGIFVIEDDKQSVTKSENDWNRMQLMVAYNF